LEFRVGGLRGDAGPPSVLLLAALEAFVFAFAVFFLFFFVVFGAFSVRVEPSFCGVGGSVVFVGDSPVDFRATFLVRAMLAGRRTRARRAVRRGGLRGWIVVAFPSRRTLPEG